MASGTFSWRQSLIPLASVIVGILLLLSQAPSMADMLPSLQNDSAMRLVQVRDLLAGQGWFDLTQYRLGPDGGFEMHWSRMVDFPIAALVSVLQPILGVDNAEYTTLILWPVLLFSAAMLATIRTAAALGDRNTVLFATLIALINFLYYGKFRPGELDHHNIQLVLLLFAVMGFVRRQESFWHAVLSGTCIALSVTIGSELIPVVAVIAGFYALAWVVRGSAERSTALWFAASLFGAVIASFLLTAAASAYRGGFCDAVSVDIVIPIALAALAVYVAAFFFTERATTIRLGFLAGMLGAVLIVTIVVFPGCLSNPLDALDPYLKENWLSRVSEARSLRQMWTNTPGEFLAVLVPALLAIALSLWLAGRRFGTGEWLFLAVLIIVAALATFYQVRGSSLLTALVTFPIAVCASQLLDQTGSRQSKMRSIGAIVILVAAFSPIWAGVDGLLKKTPTAASNDAAVKAVKPNFADCFGPSEQAALRNLPTGRFSASSNLGAQLLLQSEHRVLSAPYHRNQAGMIAQLNIALAQTDEVAASHLNSHGVDYVALCAGDAEYETNSGDSASDARFLYRVTGGYRPDFLVEIPYAGGGALTLLKFVK